MRRHHTLWPLLAALVIAPAIATRGANATTVVPVTLEQLAARSDAVLVVVPRASRSYWLGRRIVTDFDLDVQSVQKGAVSPGSRIVLQLPGGTVGGVAQMIPGAPWLTIDTPYLVFVNRAANPPGTFYLSHLTASVLPLSASPDGAVTVLPPAEGMTVAPTSSNASSASSTVMTRSGVPLDIVSRAVRSAP